MFFASMRSKTNSIKLLIYAIFQSSIAPLVFYLSDIYPAHDSRSKFEAWYLAAKSLRLSGEYPLWIPNYEEGVNSMFLLFSYGGIDQLMINLIYAFKWNATAIFAIYIFFNTLITALAIIWLFRLLEIPKIWQVVFISLNSITFYAWWQPFFNLIGLQRAIIASTFILYLFKNKTINAFLLLTLYTIVILPFGYVSYFALVLIGVQLLAVLYFFASRKNRKAFLSSITNPIGTLKINGHKKVVPALFFFILVFYLYYQISFVLFGSREITVTTAGRNNLGLIDLNTFLEYGGALGWSKFLSIIGSISALSSNLDFPLLVGPFAGAVLIQVIVYYIRTRSPMLKKFNWTIMIIVGISVPLVPLATLLYYVFPFVAFSRHIASYSIFLIPIVYVMFGLWWKKVTEPAIAESRNVKRKESKGIKLEQFIWVLSFSISAIIFCATLYSLIDETKLYDNVFQKLYPAFVFIALSFFGLLFVKKMVLECIQIYNREKAPLSRIAKSAPILLLASNLMTIPIVTILIYDFQKLNNENYLVSANENLSVELPLEREPRMTRVQELNSLSTAGAIYPGINTVLNLDNCGIEQRKDLISKSIFDAAGREASFKDILPLYRGSFIGYLCEKNKSSRVYFVNDEGLEVKGSYTFKELNYNRVVIDYKLSQLKENPVFLVYRDANSRIGLWKASVFGKEVTIVENVKGYKSIKLSSNSGTLEFNAVHSTKLREHLKAVIDILVLFWLFWFLIRKSSLPPSTSNNL